MVVRVERAGEAWAPLSLPGSYQSAGSSEEPFVRLTHVHRLPFPEPVFEFRPQHLLPPL